MDISDMNSEIIFPLELFAALTAAHRLNLTMDGGCVSVESTLVFGLEGTHLTGKSCAPMVSDNVTHQQFPLLECFWTIGTDKYFVSQLKVDL